MDNNPFGDNNEHFTWLHVPRKLARMNAGLAAEDETIGQARHTAKLRQDGTYVTRWVMFQLTYDD